MKKTVLSAIAAALALSGSAAQAATFEPGTLIIPMDTTYQDMGMLKAYGLVYELLRQGVTVNWVIRKDKAFGEADFSASASDHQTGAAIQGYGYRGGPWVVAAADAAKALPIVDAWQAKNTTVVHVATAQFSGDVSRQLVVAPTIAMFADGNQNIARGYVTAAGIPDSTLDLAWPDTSPDMLDPVEVAGPTNTNHHDGKLFDADGDPVYCQLMSMHWAVKDARATPEVVAEVRSFLTHPTHFFAECQAVNAYENDLTNGLFLTKTGFVIDKQPTLVDFYNPNSTFGQIDGTFQTVGGSEPSYSIPPDGGAYKAGGIVMVTAKGTPEGFQDVWMTGYLDGVCPPDSDVCGSLGKVSYLGGHSYSTTVPISKNPDTQGTRLFLNSLFEAQCATASGLPKLLLSEEAPAFTSDPNITLLFLFSNGGSTVALDAALKTALPAGATFVSASSGGTFSNGTVTWDLDNLGSNETFAVSVTLQLPAYGTYQSSATLDYRVGMNKFSMASNQTAIEYGLQPEGGSAAADAGDHGDGDGDGDADAAAASDASGPVDSGERETTDASTTDGASGAAGQGGAGGAAGAAVEQVAGDSGGCGCRVAGGERRGAVFSLIVAWALASRRSRRNREDSNAS